LCTNLASVCIPEYIEILEEDFFLRCPALREVAFAADSRLRTIEDFGNAHPRARWRFPALAFMKCSVMEVGMFCADGHLRPINGFVECASMG
jgi:hypothetical protein